RPKTSTSSGCTSRSRNTSYEAGARARRPGKKAPWRVKSRRVALRTSRSGSATSWSMTSSGAPSAPIRWTWSCDPGWASISIAASLGQIPADTRDLAGHPRVLPGPCVHLLPGRGRCLAVAVEELLVARHLRHHGVDWPAHAIEQALEIGVRQCAGQRMVVLWHHALAEHAVGPRIQPEQLVLALPGVAGLAEHLDPLGQARRQFHLPALLPQRLVALVEVVVQHDEITHVLQLLAVDLVVAVHRRLADALEREELHQAGDRAQGQVDAGGLQRLDEAARQAEGDHILVPGLEPAPGAERDDPRVTQRLGRVLGKQLGGGLVIGHVRIGIHDAAPDAVLERNLPVPAGLVR